MPQALQRYSKEDDGVEREVSTRWRVGTADTEGFKTNDDERFSRKLSITIERCSVVVSETDTITISIYIYWFYCFSLFM